MGPRGGLLLAPLRSCRRLSVADAPMTPAALWPRQVAACAKLAKDAIAAGNCAVIGLQSTGEANTNTQKEVLQEAGEDFDDLVSAPRMIIEKVGGRTVLHNKRELHSLFSSRCCTAGGRLSI